MIKEYREWFKEKFNSYPEETSIDDLISYRNDPVFEEDKESLKVITEYEYITMIAKERLKDL